MLGVDIGGTGVRAARVDGDAIVSEVVRRPLTERSLPSVVKAVREVHAQLGGSAVGVGMPGFIRSDGVLTGSPNFPSWNAVNLGEVLTEALGVPTIVGNDANLAGLGLWRVRGGTEDLVLLTLGTGVGGGVVLDGRPLVGRAGTAAELGHIHVGGTRRCGCGGIGCLEMWCGTVGLIAAARERGIEVSGGSSVVQAADDGEAWARDVLAEAGVHLGKGLVTLVNTFAPDVIAIGGGLTAARAHFSQAEAWLAEYGVPPSVAHAKVVWEGPVDEFAIIGAAELAGRQLK